MPRPKAHYSLIARNHVSEKRLKVELIDLPFSDGRRWIVDLHKGDGRRCTVESDELLSLFMELETTLPSAAFSLDNSPQFTSW